MSKNRTSRFMPVIVAVSIVTGILIGTFYANHFSGNKLGNPFRMQLTQTQMWALSERKEQSPP